MPDGPILLDCLEFDDRLRYVDGIDDAAFLAMDLEFHGRRDLADSFLDDYARSADDPAPQALRHFSVAYRAVVRAKVDCVRVGQGHSEAAGDAQRHLDIALEHLRAGTVRLVVVGGGPGTGKSTVARSLSALIGAQILSTDSVRGDLRESGTLRGQAGTLHAGLYTPEQVAIVYAEVLRRARLLLSEGRSVILDGTWRDPAQRRRARRLADETDSVLVEFVCTVPSESAAQRVVTRGPSDSDATPQIAAALSGGTDWPGAHPLDTSRPLEDTVSEAHQLCRQCELTRFRRGAAGRRSSAPRPAQRPGPASHRHVSSPSRSPETPWHQLPTSPRRSAHPVHPPGRPAWPPAWWQRYLSQRPIRPVGHCTPARPVSRAARRCTGVQPAPAGASGSRRATRPRSPRRHRRTRPAHPPDDHRHTAGIGQRIPDHGGQARGAAAPRAERDEYPRASHTEISSRPALPE